MLKDREREGNSSSSFFDRKGNDDHVCWYLISSYYERLIGNAMKIFSDIVMLGEMINSTIKSGKVSIAKSLGSVKKSTNKGKKKEVNTVSESHPRFNQNPQLA